MKHTAENKGKLSTVLYFLNRYKKLSLLIVLTSLIVAFLETFTIAAIMPVLNSVFGLTRVSGSGSNIITDSINYLIHVVPINDKMVGAILILLIATIMKSVSRVLNEWAIAYSSGKIMYDTRRLLMEKLSSQQYQYFLDNKQGEIGYFLTNASAKVGALILKVSLFISELFMIASIVFLLFAMNIYVTLVCIGVGLFFSVMIGVISKNISYTLGKGRMESSANQSVIFNEFFNGIKQIMIFGAKNRWLTRFNKYNKQFTGLYVRDFVWLAMPTNLIETLGLSAILMTLLVLRSQVGGGSVTAYIPLTGVFAMALLKVLPALGTVGRARLEILGAIPDSEAIIDIVNSDMRARWPGGRKFESFEKSIRFVGVSFSHDNNKKLFRGINLSIEKNKLTAIVGSSGAGKTTIINLLLGLFKPSSGSILVDGVDLAEYDIESFRQKVGFVSQDSFVFHSTIRENITFCSDTYSEEEIVGAARLANVHDFISSLKDGYDTVVGERGMKLSGGQQQRIAIARALIRKPEIIILDEATSALDNKSVQEIHESMGALAKRHTIVMIAHRLDTIKNADKILILSNGMISEEGNHAELLKRSSAYKDLYRTSE